MHNCRWLALYHSGGKKKKKNTFTVIVAFSQNNNFWKYQFQRNTISNCQNSFMTIVPSDEMYHELCNQILEK